MSNRQRYPETYRALDRNRRQKVTRYTVEFRNESPERKAMDALSERAGSRTQAVRDCAIVGSVMSQSTRLAILEDLCRNAKDCGEHGEYIVEWCKRHVPEASWGKCADTMDFYGLPMAGELRKA